jgi:uncharacterized surface protein with fasciclin (FAS1) repeats
MTSPRLLTAAAAFCALIAGQAFAQPAPSAPAPEAAPAPSAPAATAAGAYRPIAPAGDILSTLQASGEFTTFLKAAQATNLTTILKNQPNITVLAPTDAAFAAMPADQLNALMQPGNVAQLQKLVTYHLINARLPSPDIKGHAATPIPSVAGVPVTLDGSGEAIKVNDATVIQPDVTASNGVIHVIDKVLLPPTTAASLPEPAGHG